MMPQLPLVGEAETDRPIPVSHLFFPNGSNILEPRTARSLRAEISCLSWQLQPKINEPAMLDMKQMGALPMSATM
jgi:hypothetical protein